MLMLYLLNGSLALLWFLVDHLLLVLMILPLAWLAYTTPAEQRSWTWASCGLAFLTAALTPVPVPVLLLVMTVAGNVAIRLEQFNVTAARWNTTRGLALYSLAGLGYLAFQTWMQAPIGQPGTSPLLAQGQNYLAAIAGIAMYVIPLGFLALLSQSLWAHPPMPGKPAEFTHAVRSRRKG